LAGGFAGYVLTAFLCQLLSRWHAPMDFPVQFGISPDWRVFFFALTVSTATGVLFGLGPALQMSQIDPARPRFRFAFRDLRVATEVGLCFVLVFGAMLSLRALQNALVMPLGFNPNGV